MKTLSDLQNMDNKWVVITGGAGHVGQMISELVVELGGHVILVDIQRPSHSISSSDNVHFIECNLEDSEQILSMKDKIESITEGPISCLINNAAFVGTTDLSGWCVPFQQQSFDTFERCMRVNLNSPFLLSQTLAPLLNAGSQISSIINVSSIYSLVGPKMKLYEGTEMGNPAAYAASKGGLNQLTKWMAATLAPKVRVNSIILGGIARGQDERFVQRYSDETLLGRMATEEDLKGAFAFLMSSMSSYVTGQSLIVDGGWTAI